MAGALAAGLPGGLAAALGGARLTPLRDDLSLHPGPPTRDGAPTWTLYDPGANRFLRIGWLEFEVLSRWELGTAERVAQAVTRATPLTVRPEDVERVARFLETAGALRADTADGVDRLAAAWRRRQQHPVAWALKNYLFVRVPLVRPDRFLDATLGLVRPLLTRGFLLLMAAIGLLGLFLAVRQWDSFVAGFAHLATPAGLVTAALALLGSKVLHELAHAYVCKRHGCRVGHMGVALLVLWPVLYTDTTDAWRLTSRAQRLQIGGAGILAELCLAAAATLAWSLLPDGPLRAAVFTLAAVTWILTLAINLNPFMRFDGYYLLSDWWDVPNLQERGFALGRWRLREALFGLGRPAPEPLPPGRRRMLIAYAYGTWVYRFFLFLAIALIVYHVFFKVLGLILMAVEIAYFIVRPIGRELIAWWGLRKEVGVNARVIALGLILVAAVGLFAVPWQTRVAGPALLRAAERGQLYAPRAAQVDAVLTETGASVAADAPLLRLASPELAHEIAKAEREIATLTAELEGFETSDLLAGRGVVARRNLAEARTRLAGLEAERAELVLAAPFAGTVAELGDHLRPGLWVTEDEPLAAVDRARAGRIAAYVTEADLARVDAGATARFYPESPDWPPVPARVRAVDSSAIQQLPDGELASVNGGSLPATAEADGTLVPDGAYYRVRLAPDTRIAGDFALRGQVLIWGERESFAERIWRRVVGIVIRESGF